MRQHVARHIKPDSCRGRTRLRFTGELGHDLTGNHFSIGKVMRNVTDRGIDEKSSSDDDEPQKRKRVRKSPSSRTPQPSSTPTPAPCFLCGQKGYFSTECKLPKDEWVPVYKLPFEVHDAARSVHNIIKRD